MNRLTAALAAAMVLPLGLTGCTTAPSDTESAVASAVAAADPGITDVYVTTANGVAGASIRVRIYVEPVETSELARIIDASLKATLVGAPNRPASFTLDVAEGSKPSDVNLNLGAIPLEDAARAADLYEHFSDDALSGPTDVLEDRFGTWDELHP